MPDRLLCTQDKGKRTTMYENLSLCFNKSSSAFKNEYLSREGVTQALGPSIKKGIIM